MPQGLGIQLGLGGGRSATSSGAPSGGTPLNNTASCDFDGSNDTCSLGFSMPAYSAFSWSGWVKTTDAQGALCGAIDSGGNLAFTRGGVVWSGSKWYFSMGNGSAASYDNTTHSCSAILDGDWHHVVKTVDGTSQKIYVDGSLNASWTSSVAAGTAGAHNIDIGSWGGLYYFTDGLIDEVALLNSALSASDVTDVYNSGVPASLSSYNPYGWWRMGDNDGSSGTTITDQGSGGNDGTLVNGPTFSTDVPS